MIKALRDWCHDEIPGPIAEDDSSWINWNRVHDFYNDHPYGNNHIWVETLAKLNAYIQDNGVEPLVLGESIAADAWTDERPLLDAVGTGRPLWLPNHFEGNRRWMELIGDVDVDQLVRESKHYAMLMRKYQMKTFRREVPSGGYVVSVIRDFPFASMGLLELFGKPKWAPGEWDWHCDSMLILKTADDRRSFKAGEHLAADVMLSHFGSFDIHAGAPTVSVVDERTGASLSSAESNIDQPRETLAKLWGLDVELPEVHSPQRFLIRAEVTGTKQTLMNEWPVWVMPTTPREDGSEVRLHHSAAQEVAEILLPGSTPVSGDMSKGATVVASKLDLGLLDFLEAAGKVLLLPDGEKAGLPLRSEWFLRVGPTQRVIR